ncbi:type II toxin-antitoxin system VapB family antitoxin [Caulobacter sp.]|uniref:type II toxin-antitoxin system VapB family antitoxin n=1 Tax=Caulobacter sp. TaxID=78 RepID=UPI001619FA2E
MSLHIANPEACELVKHLSQALGVSMSQAIKIAAKEALARREDADELDVLPAESTAE